MVPIITAKPEIEKIASRGRTKRDERNKEREEMTDEEGREWERKREKDLDAAKD